MEHRRRRGIASPPLRESSATVVVLALALAACAIGETRAALRVRVRVGGVGDLLVPFQPSGLVGDLAADVERCVWGEWSGDQMGRVREVMLAWFSPLAVVWPAHSFIPNKPPPPPPPSLFPAPTTPPS